MCVHVLVVCCIGFVVCMNVCSSAEKRPCRALELKSINQSINQSNSTLTKCDKTRGDEENSILSSIYVLLFQSTLDDIVSNQTECQTR